MTSTAAPRTTRWTTGQRRARDCGRCPSPLSGCWPWTRRMPLAPRSRSGPGSRDPCRYSTSRVWPAQLSPVDQRVHPIAASRACRHIALIRNLLRGRGLTGDSSWSVFLKAVARHDHEAGGTALGVNLDSGRRGVTNGGADVPAPRCSASDSSACGATQPQCESALTSSVPVAHWIRDLDVRCASPLSRVARRSADLAAR